MKELRSHKHGPGLYNKLNRNAIGNIRSREGINHYHWGWSPNHTTYKVLVKPSRKTDPSHNSVRKDQVS